MNKKPKPTLVRSRSHSADVFLLPNLMVLNASYNKISKIPTFNVKVHNKHWVSEVDLSDNDLMKFPSHLLLMTKKLDLGSNKIQTLNMNTMKTLEGSNDQELVIDGNPLKFPPVDICESGIKLMMEYFHEVRLEMKFYRGIKVLVLGSHRSGKTSLVMSLQDQQARLTDEVHEKGAGIDCYDASFELEPGTDDLPGKSLQVGLWDFCGHPFYLYPHYVFFEQPSLAILTFNMKEYSDDRNEHEKIINERVDKIVERQKISPTLQDQLSGFRRILMCMETFKVQGDVAVTSAANFKGYDLLKDAIITVANDNEKFPQVLTEVKTFWVDVENYLESKGSEMDVPVMHWDDYVPEITGKFGMKRLIRDITSTLIERVTQCPYCEKESFLGEWLTPKETQALFTKKCESCGQDVDTGFLVQPREKKRDDVVRNLHKARQQRRVAMVNGPSLPEMLERDSLESSPAQMGGRRRGGVLPVPDLSKIKLPQFATELTNSDEDDNPDDTDDITSDVIPSDILKKLRVNFALNDDTGTDGDYEN
ncbi:hypothetical protein KUTeg_012037 [Tegillarca granosa]|uniref:Roc domain-containing protein n=1 Tax=Tegillarca granosa TaxID=220873 RepID=A0ABQ9F1M2_TEGGR|nr:hypothetical protein KUTeg_012037 [Tegillarca granosa]